MENFLLATTKALLFLNFVVRVSEYMRSTLATLYLRESTSFQRFLFSLISFVTVQVTEIVFTNSLSKNEWKIAHGKETLYRKVTVQRRNT